MTMPSQMNQTICPRPKTYASSLSGGLLEMTATTEMAMPKTFNGLGNLRVFQAARLTKSIHVPPIISPLPLKPDETASIADQSETAWA